MLHHQMGRIAACGLNGGVIFVTALRWVEARLREIPPSGFAVALNDNLVFFLSSKYLTCTWMTWLIYFIK